MRERVRERLSLMQKHPSMSRHTQQRPFNCISCADAVLLLAALSAPVSPAAPACAFPSCMPSSLLSLLPQRAADADEPPELNFIRKHALAMKAQGLSNPAARLFSNPAGERLD